jgi:hypothetical protein
MVRLDAHRRVRTFGTFVRCVDGCGRSRAAAAPHVVVYGEGGKRRWGRFVQHDMVEW